MPCISANQCSQITILCCRDDHKLFMWTISKRDIRKVLDFPEDLYPITIAWPPKGALVVASNKKSYDVLLITASDGRMYIMARGGRMEKVVQAHTGKKLRRRFI